MEKIFAQTLKVGNYSISGPSSLRSSVTTVSGIIGEIIPFVFAFAGIGLLIMILSAGFTLLTSAGDAKKMESGKSRLTSALTGFIIIFTAYWLVQLVGMMFGLTSINTIFF
jgi:hypothetical protein